MIEDDVEPEFPSTNVNPSPMTRQITVDPNKIIHNQYLNQRKMAYTRNGYEARSSKFAEIFKNAFQNIII